MRSASKSVTYRMVSSACGRDVQCDLLVRLLGTMQLVCNTSEHPHPDLEQPKHPSVKTRTTDPSLCPRPLCINKCADVRYSSIEQLLRICINTNCRKMNLAFWKEFGISKAQFYFLNLNTHKYHTTNKCTNFISFILNRF